MEQYGATWSCGLNSVHLYCEAIWCCIVQLGAVWYTKYLYHHSVELYGAVWCNMELYGATSTCMGSHWSYMVQRGAVFGDIWKYLLKQYYGAIFWSALQRYVI
jgi:hypothetical protein